MIMCFVLDNSLTPLAHHLVTEALKKVSNFLVFQTAPWPRNLKLRCSTISVCKKVCRDEQVAICSVWASAKSDRGVNLREMHTSIDEALLESSGVHGSAALNPPSRKGSQQEPVILSSPEEGCKDHEGHGNADQISILQEIFEGKVAHSGFWKSGSGNQSDIGLQGEEEYPRKVVLLCSALTQDPESDSLATCLEKASDHNIALEIIYLEDVSGNRAGAQSSMAGPSVMGSPAPLHRHSGRQEANGGVGSEGLAVRESFLRVKNALEGYESCSVHRVPCDSLSLTAEVMRWVQELRFDGAEASMELCLKLGSQSSRGGYRGVAAGSLEVQCSAFPLIAPIRDTILPCRACRCHGAVLRGMRNGNQAELESHVLSDGQGEVTCPISGQSLDGADISSSVVQIASDYPAHANANLLHLPSFKNSVGQPLWHTCSTPPANLTVLRQLDVQEVNDALLFGIPHLLLPSSNVEIDFETGDCTALSNNQATFSALCSTLRASGSGLLCCVCLDLDTRMDTSIPCFYIVVPAAEGAGVDQDSMLIKRIATLEEVLPLPPHPLAADEEPIDDTEIRRKISNFLRHKPKQAYNPVEASRGLHLKVQALVKDSLSFRPSRAPDQQRALDNPNPASLSCGQSSSFPSAKTLDGSTAIYPNAADRLRTRTEQAKQPATGDAPGFQEALGDQENENPVLEKSAQGTGPSEMDEEEWWQQQEEQYQRKRGTRGGRSPRLGRLTVPNANQVEMSSPFHSAAKTRTKNPSGRRGVLSSNPAGPHSGEFTFGAAPGHTKRQPRADSAQQGRGQQRKQQGMEEGMAAPGQGMFPPLMGGAGRGQARPNGRQSPSTRPGQTGAGRVNPAIRPDAAAASRQAHMQEDGHEEEPAAKRGRKAPVATFHRIRRGQL